MTPFSGEKPQRNDRATFSVRVDAFITWLLGTFFPELQAVVAAFNFNATNSTSTTSILISIASKSLTVQPGKSYVPGMAVTIAYTTDATKWMRGEVTSYDAVTGALVVNVRTISQTSGTFSSWTISQAAVESLVGNHIVTVHTGNGHGSTNTKWRRFQTIKESIGVAVTYADSASNGASFTINEDGLYEIYYYDCNTSTRAFFGITVNNSQGTTSISSVTGNDRVLYGSSSTVGGVTSPITRIVKLLANDVFYAHTDGSTNASNQESCYLSVRKIANV
ncbi:MAG: hypothetical protein JSR71_09400 [Proteobacteria bacterium]|nr:hypothetical protein [Pseudomonadota bacterium]